MTDTRKKLFDNLDGSALLTILGIVALFSTAVIVTLITPLYMDPTWIEPTNPYQVQMYEVSDPNLYISRGQSISGGLSERHFVYHLKNDFTLIALQENEFTRILAPQELDKYVTRFGDKELKLTSRLLLLRAPEGEAVSTAETKRQELLQEWQSKQKPEENGLKPAFQILELYAPEKQEAFAAAPVDSILENWVDSDFKIIDSPLKQPYHSDPGVIYVNNPVEFRIVSNQFGHEHSWKYNPSGEPVASLEQLTSHPLDFHSRKELIEAGEHFYAIEGCWYCHTDQTRTLIQDTVLNGSDTYPAPPSSANEYIYQKITFPGTRRIGPDISRVGIKRPGRDWHQGHFWEPRTASKGSIMPSFRHLFDDDPRGTSGITPGIPNYEFEALFQYLMTKGTRITPPTQAWWLGKDPINTKAIIEGRKKL